VTEAGRCRECGRLLVDGACSECDALLLYRFVQREIVVLASLTVIAILAFLLTRQFAAANRGMSRTDAAGWYLVGAQQLASGMPALAVNSLQRASTAARSNSQYRLALAQALTANQQDDAARQVLLGLRQVTPEDPDVNAQLARLAVRSADAEAALRYYQSALYGQWSSGRLTERRRLRSEFIRYLLSQKQNARALSQLLVLSEDLPANAAAQLEAGRLYSAAGDLRRARDHFNKALELDSSSDEARAEAGAASVALGEYITARSYLVRVAEQDPAARAQLELVDAVLALDPARPRLTTAAKTRRLQLGLERAIDRVNACAAQLPAGPAATALLQSAQAARSFARSLTTNAIRDGPDLVDAALDRIAALETSVPAECGEATAQDRALLLIAGREGRR
jgi:tetratricopeptide (TPR) repeat protein